MLEQDLQLILSSAIDRLADQPAKVHRMFVVAGHAQDLALNEEFEEVERQMTLAAAMLHNVGQGEYEKVLAEGRDVDEADLSEAIIREMLETSDLNTFEIEGILILVRTHKQIGFLDNAMHQVLSEAQMLADIAEAEDPGVRAKELSESFKTESGRTRLKDYYPEAF